MSTKSKEKQKVKKGAKNAEFKADAVVEGRIPIKPQDEVDIQGAREVLEMRSRRSLGKSYKVKVIGTDTRIILKRKSVVSSAPRELSLLCNEIYRFFIFARNPKLVILVIPEKTDGDRAYLLLKMKTDIEANRFCTAIENGRKKLRSPAAQIVAPSPKTAGSTDGAGTVNEAEEVEMQENGKSVDRPESINDTLSHETDSVKSESDNEEAKLVANKDSTPDHSSRTTTPSHRTSEQTPVMLLVDETFVKDNARAQVESAVPTELEISSNTEKSESTDDTPPRSLPRAPLESFTPPPQASTPPPTQSAKGEKKAKNRTRRAAPVTEEMFVEPPKNWKASQPLHARLESDLRAALVRDLYDDDWAVDVKLIRTDGAFGSRISETGNIYMFTAHHLVADNSFFDCTSSSDEELELKEKPFKRAQAKNGSDYSLDKNASLNSSCGNRRDG